MSSLTKSEKRQLEKLLNSSGYVYDFSNQNFGDVPNFSDRTFGEFFDDTVKIDIHSGKYKSGGTSKMNKLRTFWDIETDYIVGKVLHALVEPATSHERYKEQALQCLKIANRLLSGNVNLAHLKGVAVTFDAKYLAEQIRRMEESIEKDPSLAIGTAKELIETCCKTILAERGNPVSGTPDIPLLTKQTLKELRLTPDDIPEATRGNEAIKRLLQNLSGIGNGLAELRNLYGTGHGKHGHTKGLSPRHAKLAVGTASTFATFLFDTNKETRL